MQAGPSFCKKGQAAEAPPADGTKQDGGGPQLCARCFAVSQFSKYELGIQGGELRCA